MARKRYSDEDVLHLLREIELALAWSGCCHGMPLGRSERCDLRHEVLNAEWFATTKQAQIVINQWLRQYNYIRPHQALNMRPPVPETVQKIGP